MINVILAIGLHVYFNSDPALTALQTRPFQLAKMQKKIAILTLIFEKFAGGIQTPIPERSSGAPPQTQSPRVHLDCQVLREPQYLNPALP